MGFIAICHHCNMPSQRALLCKPKSSKLMRRMDIVMFTCVAPTRRMDIAISTCVAPTRRMDIVMHPYGLANKHSDLGFSPVSYIYIYIYIYTYIHTYIHMTPERDPNQSVCWPNRKGSSQCPSVASARRRWTSQCPSVASARRRWTSQCPSVASARRVCLFSAYKARHAVMAYCNDGILQ